MSTSFHVPIREMNVLDTLLPSQLLDDLTARASGTPERRLMAAVLLDAAVQLSRRGSRAAVDAEQWIRAGDAANVALSFGRVCEMLNLDASYLARGLVGLRVGDVDASDLPRQITRTRNAASVAPARRRRQPRRTKPSL